MVTMLLGQTSSDEQSKLRSDQSFTTKEQLGDTCPGLEYFLDAFSFESKGSNECW